VFGFLVVRLFATTWRNGLKKATRTTDWASYEDLRKHQQKTYFSTITVCVSMFYGCALNVKHGGRPYDCIIAMRKSSLAYLL